MFRKCRFCICWIWVWIYLGYWVELGNFQKIKYQLKYLSLLSTAELHRRAMCSSSIFLAFLLEVSSWEGWPTGVFKHAFIHTCISLSKQSYLYDFERKYRMKKIRWGRKPALLISILASSGGELVGAFMPEFWSYAASRLRRRHSECFFSWQKSSQSTLKVLRRTL